jgi:release factor glutamine methyltransferase
VPPDRCDAIVANPPYVALDDPHLRDGDLRFEPRGALASGVTGLSALAAIVAGARDRLVPGGFLAVEHGFDQAETVHGLFDAAGFTAVEGFRDLAGIRRVVVGQAPATL